MNINDAIKLMKEKVKDKYAIQYLNTIPNVIDEGGMHGLCVQMKYILENTKTWRGEEARKTKEFVRNWISEKGCDLD